MDSFYHFCLFLIAQTQTVPVEGAGAGNAAEEVAKDPGLFGGFGGMLIPIMLGVMLLYVLMSSKQPAAGAGGKTDLLANLKKNDRVITAGGIVGTVVNYRSDSEYVTLRVDDSTNARIQVLATSIFRVVSDDDAKKES
ncbi:MAG: preprotein translocase subunit YajC [Planctomycetota bacterium]